MKNWEVVKMFNSLTSKTLQESKTVLPTVVLVAKMKNIRVLTPYMQEWETAKNELIKQFGTKNEENGNYSVSLENSEFTAEFDRLNNIDHTELDELVMYVNVEDLPEEMKPQEFELLSAMVNL